MTLKPWMRRLIVVLVALLVLSLGIEAFLWYVDPLGIATYITDLSAVVTIPNAEGYTLASGMVTLRNWSYTIDEQGNRVMPASDGDCTIRFLGDSVTFGEGVDDPFPFPYLFAQEFPHVQFVNMAKIAYNIGNIRYGVEHSPADGYIYYQINNDQGLAWARPPSDYGTPRQPPPRFSAIRDYIAAFQEMYGTPLYDLDGFWRDLAALTARDDVLIFVMDSTIGQEVVQRYPALPLIPDWSPHGTNSWIDWHPNASGHEFLKAQMESAVRDFVARRCGQSAVSS